MLRREGAVGVQHEALRLGPGVVAPVRLRQRRIAVPPGEPFRAEPPGLQAVIAVGERGIGPLDRADQRIDHLVLDPVLQVARGDGAGETAPAVVDLLVLEQRIEDMGEEPLVFPEHGGERRGRRPAHARIGMREPVQRLLQSELPVAEREAQARRASRRTAASRPRSRPRRGRAAGAPCPRQAGAGGRTGSAPARGGSGPSRPLSSSRRARRSSSISLSSSWKKTVCAAISAKRSWMDWWKRPVSGDAMSPARMQARIAEQPGQAFVEPLIGLDRVGQLLRRRVPRAGPSSAPLSRGPRHRRSRGRGRYVGTVGARCRGRSGPRPAAWRSRARYRALLNLVPRAGPSYRGAA